MSGNEVVTFGCRLNIYESEVIKENLRLSGMENVTIFNTCSVTKSAEKDAYNAIRKYKKNNPDKKIIVTGCAVQTNTSKFVAMPEIDQILGNEEKMYFQNYSIDNEDNRVLVNDIMSVKETAHYMLQNFTEHSRAFIQVQNGCNHRCTFCIIPYGRGNSRSVPIGAIVQQLRKLVENGYNEVVLTGVDLTSYGPDLPGAPTFAQMIRRVLSGVPDLKRLRISSIDLAEVDSDLYDLIVNEERIMPHLHISLQSGDDMILKRMKRRHNRQMIIDLCNNLRHDRPNMAFGADIIAGFPTETDEMFQNTYNVVLEADIQFLHVFPYSPREETPAAKMPQVPQKIRKERAALLRQLGLEQERAFFNKYVDKNASVLVESEQFGHTENFIPLNLTHVEKKDKTPGRIIGITITPEMSVY